MVVMLMMICLPVWFSGISKPSR